MKPTHLLTCLVLSFLLFFSAIAQAGDDNQCDCAEVSGEETFEDIDWDLVHNRMKSLSTAGYHPFLMPLIMANSDFIELSDAQLEVFKRWRKKNRVKVLHLMDKIIYERNQFHKLALKQDTREEVLVAKQEKIFKLHQKVLRYQLSCRREILDTFTEQQWENFNFVLSSNGYVID